MIGWIIAAALSFFAIFPLLKLSADVKNRKITYIAFASAIGAFIVYLFVGYPALLGGNDSYDRLAANQYSVSAASNASDNLNSANEFNESTDNLNSADGGETTISLQKIQQAFTNQPDNRTIAFALLVALLRDHQFEAAEAHYNNAIGKNGDDAEILFRWAEILIEEQQIEKAQQPEISQNKSNDKSDNFIAGFPIIPDKSAVLLKRAYALNQKDWRISWLLGLASSQKKQFKTAAKWWNNIKLSDIPEDIRKEFIQIRKAVSPDE